MKVMRLYEGSLLVAEDDVVIAVDQVEPARACQSRQWWSWSSSWSWWWCHNDDEDDIVSFVGHLRQLGHVIVQVLLAGHLLVSQEYRRVPVDDDDDEEKGEDDEDKHCRWCFNMLSPRTSAHKLELVILKESLRLDTFETSHQHRISAWECNARSIFGRDWVGDDHLCRGFKCVLLKTSKISNVFY